MIPSNDDAQLGSQACATPTTPKLNTPIELFQENSPFVPARCRAVSPSLLRDNLLKCNSKKLGYPWNLDDAADLPYLESGLDELYGIARELSPKNVGTIQDFDSEAGDSSTVDNSVSTSGDQASLEWAGRLADHEYISPTINKFVVFDPNSCFGKNTLQVPNSQFVNTECAQATQSSTAAVTQYHADSSSIGREKGYELGCEYNNIQQNVSKFTKAHYDECSEKVSMWLKVLGLTAPPSRSHVKSPHFQQSFNNYLGQQPVQIYRRSDPINANTLNWLSQLNYSPPKRVRELSGRGNVLKKQVTAAVVENKCVRANSNLCSFSQQQQQLPYCSSDRQDNDNDDEYEYELYDDDYCDNNDEIPSVKSNFYNQS